MQRSSGDSRAAAEDRVREGREQTAEVPSTGEDRDRAPGDEAAALR